MAEENKNIDKFFSDRLAKNQVEEKDWNIPSDDIWLAAKPHFVKKEKSKKRFIFWFFGAAIIASSLLAYGTTKPIKDKENIIATNTPVSNKKESPNTEDKKTNDTTPNEEYKIKALKKTTKSKQNNLKNNGAFSAQKNKKKSIDSAAKSTDAVSEFHTNTLVEGNFNNQRGLGKPSSAQIINPLNQAADDSSLGDISAKVTSIDLKTSELANNKIISAPEILTGRRMAIQSEDQKRPVAELMILATKPIIQTPKYEVGISHSEYLARLYLEAASSIDEEEIVLDLKYSLNNVNLSGRKWINNRFSYTYGVNATLLDLNADLEILDTLDQDISNFVKDKYSSATRRNIDSGSLQVELLDGAELIEGDIVKVKGNVNLKFMALQFPLMLDYHIYKNKMEYLFGTGLSFEVLHASQDEIDISIFKDGELVNKPLISEPDSELFYDYSAYASIGAKYHFNKNWNIGLSTKIALIDPNFSYAEIGIYHRWHK